MSDHDSFIHEVSEEVRRDRLYAFLGRWGWLIALVLLLVVGGTGWMEWRKHARSEQAQAAGDALRAALAETDPAARAERLDALAASGEAALVARFAEAGSHAQAGDAAAAGEVLARISTAPETPEIYRGLANLQRVMLLGPELPRSERLATLETLTAPASPFRPLALEQRAILHIEEGDMAAAEADLQAILGGTGAAEALTARARQLLTAIGGTLPVDGTVEAVPADDGAAQPADG